MKKKKTLKTKKIIKGNMSIFGKNTMLGYKWGHISENISLNETALVINKEEGGWYFYIIERIGLKDDIEKKKIKTLKDVGKYFLENTKDDYGSWSTIDEKELKKMLSSKLKNKK